MNLNTISLPWYARPIIREQNPLNPKNPKALQENLGCMKTNPPIYLNCNKINK
jgi:hypothetical protein